MDCRDRGRKGIGRLERGAWAPRAVATFRGVTEAGCCTGICAEDYCRRAEDYSRLSGAASSWLSGALHLLSVRAPEWQRGSARVAGREHIDDADVDGTRLKRRRWNAQRRVTT